MAQVEKITQVTRHERKQIVLSKDQSLTTLPGNVVRRMNDVINTKRS